MFVESRANTNVHRFHAQPASWRPFWISNFSQTSYIWHVVILFSVDTMVIKRQMCQMSLKKPLGGHFEFPISANLFSCGMSLYLAIFLSNMKTIGPILWPPWWSTGKIVIFVIENQPLAAILNFRYSTNSFPDILSPIPTPMPNLTRNAITWV